MCRAIHRSRPGYQAMTSSSVPMSQIFGCVRTRVTNEFLCEVAWSVPSQNRVLIDASPKPIGGILQQFEKFAVSQSVTDDHDVDVAGRAVRALRDGTVNESSTDGGGGRGQGGPQNVSDA